MFEKIKIKLTTPETLIAILSLCITGCISAIVGTGCKLMFGVFLGPFIIAFGVQFVLFFVVNTILQKRDTLTEIKLANEQLEALSKHLIKLTCSYCSKPNTLSITLNRENRFKCEFCQQMNGVKMQFFATQITTPIEKVLIPTSNETTVEYKTTRV
jgi:hypothetical protein